MEHSCKLNYLLVVVRDHREQAHPLLLLNLLVDKSASGGELNDGSTPYELLRHIQDTFNPTSFFFFYQPVTLLVTELLVIREDVLSKESEPPTNIPEDKIKTFVSFCNPSKIACGGARSTLLGKSENGFIDSGPLVRLELY